LIIIAIDYQSYVDIAIDGDSVVYVSEEQIETRGANLKGAGK
jgi:hypothetical protein